MEKIKIAIIGCGGIARNEHAPAYVKLDNVEIVACCDIIPERAEAIAKMCGAKQWFTDYKDVLALEEVEAVDICTPNYLHSIIAVDALNAGKHVFCEKPDAVSVEEAKKMQAAADKNNKVLMVMRNNRHRPESKYLKKYIEEGKMGEIYAARCCWQRRRGIPGKGGWFTTKALSGGGPLIDLGVHMIDLGMYLMGNPTPVSVSGCTYNKFAGSDTSADSENAKYGDSVTGGTFDVEDLAMGFIRFSNGACMQIEFSWASNVEKENAFIELRGTKAGTTFAFDQFKIFTEECGTVADLIPQVKRESDLDAHGLNLKHFVDVVKNGAEPDFVPQQGINMVAILEAIYKSAETGKEVIL